MNSTIFHIRQMSAPWEGLHYSVSWSGRGAVREHRYVMLEQAFKTGDYSVGITNGSECVRVNADVVLSQSWSPEFLDHMFGRTVELTAVAFSELKYAEDFVDRMEKIIAWKMLVRRERV